jgi:hypothetical protein
LLSKTFPTQRAIAWRLRRRCGSTIARTAVMRKLATAICRVLSNRQTYAECGAIALVERFES